MTRTFDPRKTGVSGGGPERGHADTPQARAMQLVAQAHLMCDEGRAAEAEDMCRWVLNQAPNLASAQVAFGRARFEQGHLQEARAILESAMMKHPAFFTGHRWLAEVLVRLGDWPAASAVLVRAEALSPGQPRVAELVRQVMGVAPPMVVRGTGPAPIAAAPGRTEEVSGPAPPPPTQSAQQRRQTYMGPAVPDEVAEREPSPRAPPVRPASAAHGNTPTRRVPMPTDPGAPPPRVPGSEQPTAVAASGRLMLARERAQEWTRRHPRAALLLVSVTLFTLAALGVLLVAPKPTTTRLQPEVNTGANEVEVPPVRGAAFDELASIMTADRRLHGRASLVTTSRALLAEALMSSEYGRPVAAEAEALADELGKTAGNAQPEELQAARVLFRLARGDRTDAGALVLALAIDKGESPLLRFADARRLSRQGDASAAIARLGVDAERSPFLPTRLLLAELHLDQGEPRRALALVRQVLVASPGHPQAVQLLLEGTHGLGSGLDRGQIATVERGCRAAQRRVPTLDTACRLNRGLLARREGQRQAAMGQAFGAMEMAPAEPRLLATIAQLLVNLGATPEAQSLVRRAEALADRKLPPLAWARAGVILATNRRMIVPPGVPPGPEARLIALRASFVGPRMNVAGSAVLAGANDKPPDDRDLRWVADGTRVKGQRPGAKALTAKVRTRYGRRPPGPVASFVAGALARRAGKDELARAWLSRSLDGHGDACRAASLYRLVLIEDGTNPRLVAQLQRAIGRLGCERF
jgi:tetratricopeptide (TPR) repeat protein